MIIFHIVARNLYNNEAIFASAVILGTLTGDVEDAALKVISGIPIANKDNVRFVKSEMHKKAVLFKGIPVNLILEGDNYKYMVIVILEAEPNMTYSVEGTIG